MTDWSVKKRGDMAPRSEAAFEKIRGESRVKIMGAALELFSRNGYSQTSIEAIAKRAGVAKGLIYNYFSTKEELLHQAFLSCFEGVESAFGQLMTIDNPVMVVELFIDGLFNLFMEQMDIWRLQTGILLNPEIPPKIREVVLAKLGEYSMFITQLFMKCGVEDAESEAWIFAASCDGILLYYLLYGATMPIDGCRLTLKKKYRHLIEQSLGKESR